MTEIRHEPDGSLPPAAPFKSLEEEAEHWDTHSFTEEIDPAKPVTVKRANKSETLTVRFEPEDMAGLREQAARQGIGPTTLVRMLVLQQLRERGQH